MTEPIHDDLELNRIRAHLNIKREDWYAMNEVARIIGLKQRQARTEVDAVIPHMITPSGQRRVLHADLAAYLNQRTKYRLSLDR